MPEDNILYMCMFIPFFIICILFFIYILLTRKKTTTSTNSDINIDLLNKGLVSAGVTNITEYFDNTIVFDTSDKITNNFSEFINIYFKYINIDNINKYINKYINISGVNTTSIETTKNINFINAINDIADISCFNDTSIDIILTFLSSITLINIQYSSRGKLYYLDDLTDSLNSKTFNIYGVPNGYSGNINNLKYDSNTQKFDFQNNIDYTKPFYFEGFFMIEHKINQRIIEYNMTHDDYLNMMKDNKQSIIKLNELYLAGMYIAGYIGKANINENTQIVKDIYDFIHNTNPPSFTPLYIEKMKINSLSKADIITKINSVFT